MFIALCKIAKDTWELVSNDIEKCTSYSNILVTYRDFKFKMAVVRPSVLVIWVVRVTTNVFHTSNDLY